MKKLMLTLLFAVWIAGIPANAQALLLYKDTFLNATREQIDPVVGVQGFYVNDFATEFFNGYTIDLSDPLTVGSIFTSSAGDVGFGTFAAYLTDGIEQSWQARFVLSNGIQALQRSEPLSFGTSLFSANNIDLAGYRIDQLQFSVDSVEALAAASGFRWTTSISVFGDLDSTPNAIPEPSTLLLLGMGMTGMIIRRRRDSDRAAV